MNLQNAPFAQGGFLDRQFDPLGLISFAGHLRHRIAALAWLGLEDVGGDLVVYDPS